MSALPDIILTLSFLASVLVAIHVLKRVRHRRQVSERVARMLE